MNIELKYYFVKIVKSLDEGYLKIKFDTRFFSKDIKVIYPEDTVDNQGIVDEDKDTTEDNGDLASDNQRSNGDLQEVESKTEEDDEKTDEDNFSGNINLIRKYAPEILNLKKDILDILLTFTKIIFLDENYINLSFGLIDNNMTIKVSSFLWAITAPFYAKGLRVIITPIMDEAKLNVISRLNFQLSLLVLLKVIIKIISNIKMVKLIISLFKELK
ncbi:MAG: hypothetical protein Q4Q22_00335 [Methanosphaera sp.]|nr:hypothetical protein [Methanosphaera sp.]